MSLGFYEFKIPQGIGVYLSKQMGGIVLIYIRAHETRAYTSLNELLNILLLDFKRLPLKSVILLRVVFLEVIDQLRHFAYVFFLGRHPIGELPHDAAEIAGFHRGTYFLLHVLHIRLQQLLHQLILGREIDVEGLLGHAYFTAYIVDGNRPNTEAKEHLAGRLDNMLFLVLTQNGCKGTTKN